MSRKHGGKNSTGGTRKALKPETENTRRARYEPPVGVVALLRGVWAKREHLMPATREMIASLLRQVQAGPLSERQVAAAVSGGAKLGVGYDDPALDDGAPEVKPPPGVVSVQRWGVLPMRPPTRPAG